MRTGGVPVLYIEQKPPKLFAEIELKERGSKKDEGGSYRCPTFEAPKVEYASEVPSTSSSGNTNTASAASAGGNGGGGDGDETGNTSIQLQPPQAAVNTQMSPFTPVLPPEVTAGGTTSSMNININNNNNNNNNGMNTGSSSVGTVDNNNGRDKFENKNDNQNQGGDSSNSKFAGNFKKTSTGNIVVRDASGNEIHF